MNQIEYTAALARADDLLKVDKNSPELEAILAQTEAYERIHEPDYVAA